MYYNIKNERIYLARCINCGNQINATSISTGTAFIDGKFLELNGLRIKDNIQNQLGNHPLDFVSRISSCCKNPWYYWDTEGNFGSV